MRALVFALGMALGVAANAATLGASPASVERGGSVTASWSGIASPTATDWIGVYTPGTSNLSYHRFQYTNGAASGSAPFLIPATLPSGTYELRLFAANGYTLLATSPTFTVTAPNLGVSPASIERGASVTASWSAIASPAATDWIGVYTPGTSNGSYHRLQYTNGAASGSAPFLVPATLPPGTYELRLLAANSYTLLATSATFTVTVPNISLSSSPASTTPGATVTVSWSGNPGPTTLDWIGLYTPGYPNSPTYHWIYIPQSSSGSASFTIPPGLALGTYQFRLYYNNVYALLATTSNFTVGLSVSGTITAGSSLLAGVALTASNGGTCTASNASGQYSCAVPSGWSGTVTPSLSGYSFTPASRSFTNVISNQAAQAFSAAPTSASLYFIHVDHLNTPRAIYDDQQQLRWKWEQQEPFGVNVPDENPSSLGAFEFALRFPGQYFDKETNTAYNGARNFDPASGRFVESDPLGMQAGLNTYLYALATPLAGVDPFGLITCISNPPNFSPTNCFLLSKSDTDREETGPEQVTDQQMLDRTRIPDYKWGASGSRPDQKQFGGGMPVRPNYHVAGYFVFETWYTQYTVHRRLVTDFTELWYCPGPNACSRSDPTHKVVTTCFGDWVPYTNRTNYWWRKYYESAQ